LRYIHPFRVRLSMVPKRRVPVFSLSYPAG
jgi:hypothetical protein